MLLSIKKSTLNLKRAIVRFSSTPQPQSTKKRDQVLEKQAQQPTPQNSSPLDQPVLSWQQRDVSNIFVTESTTFIDTYDEKFHRHEQSSQPVFDIIIDNDNEQILLSRFESDFIALEQLIKKHYDTIPSLPTFIDNTNNVTSSLVHNLSLRRLFTKSKTIKTNGESLELWLRSCATHPILGRSSQLRDFLCPQREHDTITTKPIRLNSPQPQHILDPAFIVKPSTTLPIAPLPQHQQPIHRIDQHSHLPIHNLPTEIDSFSPGLVVTPCYYNTDDSVLDLSSLASFCLDSIVCYSGTTHQLDGEQLNYGNNDSSQEADPIEQYKTAPSVSFPHVDHLAVASSGTAQQMLAHPLLMSSIKLAPPFEKVDALSTEPSIPTTYQSIDTAKKTHQTSPMTFDDLQCLKVLGKGCMGKVMLVRHYQSARLYALKAISKEWVLTQREIDHTMMERNILSKVSKTHHPFLIKLHQAFQNNHQLFLVMDYHVGSDLATQLQLHYSFDADRCRFYIAEILLGLQELHRLDILYRDLKPENILLAADGHIVLTDFGFSRLFDQLDSASYHTRTFCGTVEYMAAEMYLSEEYTFAVDYWALGIILYEMLLGYTPFDADNDAELCRRVLEDPVDIPDDMCPATADLILGLLERDPTQRLGCAPFFDAFQPEQHDVRHHPYFHPLNWSDVYNKRLPVPYIPHIKSETDVSHFDDDFVNLSPRLSVPFGHGAHSLCSNVDDAFAGYSYINENACLDTDSLLNDDIYQQLMDNTAPSMIIDTSSSTSCKGTNRLYHGFACTAVTTPTTVTSTVSGTMASTEYHHHTTIQEQPTSSFSSPIPYSTHPIPSSQIRSLTRFHHRHNQRYANRSSLSTFSK